MQLLIPAGTDSGAAAEEALLDTLRRVLNDVDPVPPDVTRVASAMLGWRSLLVALRTGAIPPSEAVAAPRHSGDATG